MTSRLPALRLPWGHRALTDAERLFRDYRIHGKAKWVMVAWGIALSQVASPIGSSIYFLITQVAYQVSYKGATVTLWYLKDTWDRLPVHVQNLLGQHWLASQAAPGWWVTARHDARHVLIGLIGILLVRSLTIGMRQQPRKRASTLRIVTSPLAVIAAGAIPAGILIAVFAVVVPKLMQVGVPADWPPYVVEWLGKDSWQLTLIGVVAGWCAKRVMDPVADTVQLMALEKKLADGDTERWWWRWVYPPNYLARFGYLKAAGHQPQPHGKTMGLLLALSAPVFLFLLGFGVWVLYFGPAATGH